MTDELSPADYRQLLLDAVPPTQDADTEEPELTTFFTPDTHRVSLDPEVTVVRGARGVGKTYWTKVLQDDGLRRIAAEEYALGALRDVRVVNGYGSQGRPREYPSPAVLRALLDGNARPDEIWGSVLLTALGSVFDPEARWSDKVRWVRENPEELDVVLDRVDRQNNEEGVTTLVLFDALDRLHEDRSQADWLIDGLLRVALDLRLQRRRVRAKVFIRPDMFDNAVLAFRDASKLTANSTELFWWPTNLFGLLFHRMGNERSELAASFRRSTPSWKSFAEGRFQPPGDLVGDRVRQQEVFTRLAGPWMGLNHRKGRSYTWLPNHLMDGDERVSPRSFLSAVRTAAEISANTHRGHEYALHYEAIRNGVQSASRIRVREVGEDMPWAARAVGALEGLQVPVDEENVLERWRSPGVEAILRGERDDATDSVRTGPQARTPTALIAELQEIGIMTRRVDGRIDLPDVYRVAFGIGRRGGVKRLTNPHAR